MQHTNCYTKVFEIGNVFHAHEGGSHLGQFCRFQGTCGPKSFVFWDKKSNFFIARCFHFKEWHQLGNLGVCLHKCKLAFTRAWKSPAVLTSAHSAHATVHTSTTQIQICTCMPSRLHGSPKTKVLLGGNYMHVMCQAACAVSDSQSDGA
jgi:hypothetical protein